MLYAHRWPTEDQLVLNASELAKFQFGGQMLRQHQVRLEAMLPTALRSWGNQTQVCACERRTAGFSDELFAAKQLYAPLMQPPATDAGPGAW